LFQIQNTKQYDLEDRTLKFALDIRLFVKQLPKNITNFEDVKQLIRSSASVGANYIEANESLSKKDFLMRIKISKKETKESRFWLKLIDTNSDKNLGQQRDAFINESTELMKILAAIIEKSR